MNEQNEESDGQSQTECAQQLPITTRRLVLRLPEPEDAKPFAEVANNMAIASQMSCLPHPYSEKNAESWIAASRANANPQKVSLVITLYNRQFEPICVLQKRLVHRCSSANVDYSLIFEGFQG